MAQDPFSPKQIEFINNCTAKWNLAHGAVSTGKTVCTTFGFFHAVDCCPDSDIYICGHTFDTAYRNVVRLLMESPELSIFAPFCTWSGKKLYYKDKILTVLGAKDEGAIRTFQGLTASLMYCDEITLFPEPIIDMIDTRLRKPHSKGFAAMNPSHPNHKLKQWIDKAVAGDKNYYQLHFELDDNPFISEEYKDRIRNSATGLFYKRNVLGLWVMAEGAIFDFFDKNVHVRPKPPTAAEYFIAGIDYGARNPFCCLVLGVSTGRSTQTGPQVWVENEYYWDHRKRRPKVNSELADDVVAFLEPYGVKQLYIDPSAESFQQEMRRRDYHAIHANNDVFNGIQKTCDMLRNGTCLILDRCTNLIKEIEGYVWDPREAKKGYDEPLKENDHAIDALRYCLYSHKIAKYEPYKQDNTQYLQNRFAPTKRRF